MKTLADRIEERSVNVCCLREENLFTEEHQAGHKLVRRCRACGARHTRMRALPGRLGLRGA